MGRSVDDFVERYSIFEDGDEVRQPFHHFHASGELRSVVEIEIYEVDAVGDVDGNEDVCW